jgi:glycine hydroxymethyltransferase
MKTIAHCIALAINDFENSKEYIDAEVKKLCDKYPIYQD